MSYQSTSSVAPIDLRRSSEMEAMEENLALGEEAELRLILVGKSGGGKSATGNTILGRKEFESYVSAKTTTLRCQKRRGSWRGRTVSVVDTPAMFDSESDEIVRREIMFCIQLSRPGPHALILVTQVGRFTAEDKAAANYVWDVFGAESARRTIVLFTCVEDLGRTPLQEYVQTSDNKNLRDLVRLCENRVCGFNNKAEGDERERQVSELMEMVKRTVSADGGGHYTNQLYQMSNVQDEHVKTFLARNKTSRERASGGPWSRRTKIVIVVVSSLLFVGTVIAIVFMVRDL